MQCPYDLVEPIGAGGFAQVFRGVRRDSGLVAAVKVQRAGPLAMERFKREVDSLQRLDHPHVMPIIEADPRRRWYAMPLAEITLRELHDTDPLNWDELRNALSSVCGALMHMHPNGFVHRDVSPQNVLRLPNGRWLLADYGLVHRPRGLANSITTSGMRFGTPYFSAPEVHHDPRSATAAADAYSIGALASWFTQIPPERVPSSGPGIYWSELVRATVVYDPSDRWPVPTIARHLADAPALVPVGLAAPEPCARCGGREGVDAAGRCTRCGFVDAF